MATTVGMAIAHSGVSLAYFFFRCLHNSNRRNQIASFVLALSFLVRALCNCYQGNNDCVCAFVWGLIVLMETIKLIEN